MSYELHKTEAIILGGFDIKESDRYFYLLTKDFGLLMAVALGLRELKGKLRYSLQDLTRAEVELVYGKKNWRITNARHVEHFAYPLHNKNTLGVEAMARIGKLTRKLCRGEERNEPLYQEILHAFQILVDRELGAEEVAHIEILTVMRVLYCLGYWGENSTLAYYLSGDLRDKTFRESLKPIKLVAVRAINESLKVAQL